MTPPPDGLMVYDGVCRFCSTAVRFVLWVDRAGAIRFAPTQSDYGQALCAAEGIDASDPSTFLFYDGGRALRASDGVLALFGRLPAPWRWLRVLAVVPRRWRDAAYAWVARNRYRIFGRRRVCMLPKAGDRFEARFLA